MLEYYLNLRENMVVNTKVYQTCLNVEILQRIRKDLKIKLKK